MLAPMSSLPFAFQVLYLVIAVIYVVRSFRLHRQIRTTSRDRAAEGRTAPRDHPWGWPRPTADLGLELRETTERSELILPIRLSGAEIVGPLLGYLFLSMALWISILMLTGDAPEMTQVRTVGLLFFGLPGWLCLHAGSKVARVELTRDELRLVLRFGIFFYRRVRLRRRALTGAVFSTRLQGLFAMELGQEQPDVLLLLKRRGLRLDRRMFLNCSLEAATWIAGGLRAWQELDTVTSNEGRRR